MLSEVDFLYAVALGEALAQLYEPPVVGKHVKPQAAWCHSDIAHKRVDGGRGSRHIGAKLLRIQHYGIIS